VEYLGVDDVYTFDPTQITLEQLADGVTEEWIARYWAERPLG